MALIVQKFGGSSVADAARVMNVARIVTDTYKAGNDVVVVVSAQGDTTDDLIAKRRRSIPMPLKEKLTSCSRQASRSPFHCLQWLSKSLAIPLSLFSAGRRASTPIRFTVPPALKI